MSVLSKALTSAVVVSVVCGCSGTSVGRSAPGRIATSPSEGDIATVGGSSRASRQPVTEGLTVLETKELSPTSSGLGVRLERGSGFTRLVIDTARIASATKGGGSRYDVQDLDTPPRMVLDLIGASGVSSNTVPVPSDPFLNNVRIGTHKDKTRVVCDLTSLGASRGQVERTVDRAGDQISVTFVDRSSSAALGRSATGSQQGRAEASQSIAAAGIGTERVASSRIEGDIVIPRDQSIQVSAVTFTKTAGNPGQVVVATSDETPFDLSQTAPTEYTLTIPGARAGQKTTTPMVSPPDFPGIRSARATQTGDAVQVRMFVDAGVELRARGGANKIVIEAQPPRTAAAAPEARAILGQEKPGSEPAAKAAEDDEKSRVNPTGIISDDGRKTYTGRLISLDLQDTDIDNALRIIAEVSNLNIIASDDVTGKVTLRLIDVPWDQALDVILKTNGLDQVTEGNVIRIAPVDKLRQEREALIEAEKLKIQLEDLGVRYIRVSYARVQDLKEQVESVLSERGSVSVDERTNQLIVKDVKTGQLSAKELIKKLDLRTPQVLLETQIVEASRTFLRELGFQWNFSYIASPETGNATGLVFPNSVNVGGGLAGATEGALGEAVSFPAPSVGAGQGTAITAILDSADGSRALAARVSALEQEGRVKVISRPQVATVNNKAAQIKSVETIRVRLPDSGISVATGQGASANGGSGAAVEKIEVGITLDVTPQASPDYYVLLDVHAKSSEFGSQTVDFIPSTIDREATSTILVKSGQTFAVGGVYRVRDKDNLDGVPFFKDIPVLGALFRRSIADKKDEELIFFITPHIVEGSFDPGAMEAAG